MAQVSLKELDAVNGILTVLIPSDDYLPKLTEELKKYRRTASLKGFRQGKAPMSVIKNLMGNDVKGQLINQTLAEKVQEFIHENRARIVGQPLADETTNFPNVSIQNNDDYEFNFRIGLLPEFETKGLDKSESLIRYEIEVTDEMVDEQLETYRKRLGTQEVIEDSPKEEDILVFLAREMEGGKVKKDGYESTFEVLFEDIADDSLREELKTKKKGDKVQFNIFELEKNLKPEQVKKHLLQFTEEDIKDGVETNEEYEAELTAVKRLALAEPNEEFFGRLFGEESEVKNLEDFKNRISSDYGAYFSGAIDQFMVRQMRDMLVQKNQIELPQEYLIDFLTASNEEMTKEKATREFPLFKEDLIWSLIRNRLMEKHELTLTRDDIKAQVMNEFRQYAQGLPDEQLSGLVDNMMNNEEFQVDRYEATAANQKLATILDKEFDIKPKKVSQKEFSNISNAYYDSIDTKQKAILGIEEEE